MTNMNDTEVIYRCRGCGGITQTEGLSCDCQVPSLHEWEKGVAFFGIEDPAAAIQAAMDALEMMLDGGLEGPSKQAIDMALAALNLLTQKQTPP